MAMNGRQAAALAIALALCPVVSAQGLAESQEVAFPDETFACDAANPAAGAWLGNITMPGQPVLAGFLLIQPGQDNAWEAQITCLQINALDTTCLNLQVDEASVVFRISAGSVNASFRGKISEDGQRLGGIIIQKNESRTGKFLLARTLRPMDLPDPLAFSGRSRITDRFSLPMTIVLARTPGGEWVGHLDSPLENLHALPLFNFAFDDTKTGTKIKCAVLGFPATIEVRIAANREELTGRFLQGPYDLPIDYKRAHGYVGSEVNRPQEPKPPFPYETREVTAEHPQGHVLAGTLTIPDRKRFGPGPFPTALLITGGGQQDRDETVYGHKPFLVIADYLTRHGIAAMRYDDRGVGGSAIEGETASLMDLTSKDWASDALAVLEELKSIEVVDTARTGLIGHSEGGLIAPMVARESGDIAFIVILAGPGVPGREVLPMQMSLQLNALGMLDDDDELFRDLATRAADLALAAEDEQELDAVFTKMAQMRNAGGDPTPSDELVASYKRYFKWSWLKFYLAYDPRPALAALQCPVLALNGTLDLQTWHDQNLPEIQRAIATAGGDITIKRYQGLNHLFQPAKTGSVTEYREIETTFDKQVLADITKWIRAKVGNGPLAPRTPTGPSDHR